MFFSCVIIFIYLFSFTPVVVAIISDFSDCDAVSVFIYSVLNQEVLKKFSRLKYIASRSTGFDHIDVAFCKKKNILVSNVPVYGANTVAEHTFALILSLSRKIPQSVAETKREDFSREDLTGFDLKGKTLGVVGTGNIGLHTIRIARGFQMNVLAFDLFHNKQAAAELGFHYVDFDVLLKESDIISLHAPLNNHTFHMVNSSSIKKMKKGVFLINTARGGLVDNEALVKGLKEGYIGGAGLDVLEEENFTDEEINLLFDASSERQKKILANHILLTMPNVLITPHNAFNSQEALERILDTTIENLNFFKMNKPVNLI